MNRPQISKEMAEQVFKAIKDRYLDEQKHADRLIKRILLIGGKPDDTVDPVMIGTTVQEILEKDLKSEVTAIRNYNEAIQKAALVGDNVTRKMFEDIAEEEENDHADEIATMLDQIKQMGLGQFLVQQVK